MLKVIPTFFSSKTRETLLSYGQLKRIRILISTSTSDGPQQVGEACRKELNKVQQRQIQGPVPGEAQPHGPHGWGPTCWKGLCRGAEGPAGQLSCP